jgi:hypothetical protein
MTDSKFGQHMVETKTKRALQRPFSGGIQKRLMTDNSKTRPQHASQRTFALYEQQRQQAKLTVSKE